MVFIYKKPVLLRRSSSEKLHKKICVKSNPNVVWVSNVAQNTRASELKAALSTCGKVTGAKVVVNARYPGSNCFGYVTMGSLEDVANVIAKLNNTELKGQMIKIEKVIEKFSFLAYKTHRFIIISLMKFGQTK